MKVSIVLSKPRKCLRFISKETRSVILLTDVTYTEMILLLVDTSHPRESIFKCEFKIIGFLGSYLQTNVFATHISKQPDVLPCNEKPFLLSRMCLLFYEMKFTTQVLTTGVLFAYEQKTRSYCCIGQLLWAEKVLCQSTTINWSNLCLACNV